MTRDEAREILQLYRSSGADRGDPFFAEALALAEADPVLREWFSQQQSFDASVTAASATVAVPAELRDALLSRRQQKRPFWNAALRPVDFALAAGFALLLAVGGFWLRDRVPKFASLRDSIAGQSWEGRHHVDLVSTNLHEIRLFIAAHDLPGDFKLPPELASMRPHGCRLLTIDKHQVPYICFLDGFKHLHLAIFDRQICPEPQAVQTAEFVKVNNLNLATWRQGETTFVLMGMRPLEFVKKFRKDRQWTWGG